ncbi:QRFP-like peptide receptor [Haemaphysalis longicornis]
MSPGGGNLSIVASEGDVDSPSAAGGEEDSDMPEDYEYEETVWHFDLADLVLTAAVYGATLLLGLVGNLLIVYTVSRFPRMRSIANLFLASLASADQLIVLLCVRVKFGQLFSYTWTLGEVGCKFLLYVQHVSMICSVLNLTFLSIESYYAVIHLVRCRYLCTISQARRVIIFTWPVAFLTALPIIFVIKMLILVVSLFVISWAPILVLNVLTAFGGVSALKYSYLKPLSTTFHLLSYLNSCVNPLVYGFMSRSFRCSFRDTLLGCLGQRGGPQRGATMRLSRTRTTCLSVGRSATYVT